MNKEDNKIIIDILNEQNTPIERKELWLMSKMDTEEFNNAVAYLERQGDIVIVKEGKVKKISLSKNAGCIKATIVRHSGGFCFAHPEDDSMADIFIHGSDDKGAMPGDLVLIKNIVMEFKGPAGVVHKIIERGSHIITGIYLKNPLMHNKDGFIAADTGFAQALPIVSGGSLKAKNGDKVKAAVSFDSRTNRINARVIKIYGAADSAKICADAIIDANGIPTKFTVAVKHEAAMAAAMPITDEEISKRLDLRDEPIFTIDGEDAKDLDDAISVKKLKKGWELGVHIADVSHYVREGTLLDESAMDRGTSVYFADRVIPMLPVEISNGCCSLNAGTKKLTFSAIMTLDDKAELIDYRFEKSVIVSKVRGVYSEVNKIIDNTADEILKEKYAAVYDEIFVAQELAELLKARAKQRGELEIETTELKFVLDENGVCTDVSERERGNAEELIEQFMIMANRAAALYAKSAGIPFVYRVHEAPDPDKLEALAQLAALCGLNARRLKEGVHQTDLAALIDKSKETPYSRLISTQVLRSMAKARYDNRPLGHFGLSLEDYCHFTSPIRRYPDTSIHRILTDLVSGVPVDVISAHYDEFSKKSSKMSSERELRAMRAERESEKFYAAEYMTGHIGEIHQGVVSGITNKGLFVAIENGIEGFVNLIDNENAYFEYNGTTTTRDLRSGIQYSIGDIVKIEVKSAEIALGTVDFSLVND